MATRSPGAISFGRRQYFPSASGRSLMEDLDTLSTSVDAYGSSAFPFSHSNLNGRLPSISRMEAYSYGFSPYSSSSRGLVKDPQTWNWGRRRKRRIKKTNNSDITISSGINKEKDSSDHENVQSRGEEKSSQETDKNIKQLQEIAEELKVPSELTQPLFCHLCDAKLNGSLQADSHYEGKNHAKKVKQYLEKLRLEKGITTPVPSSNSKGKAEQKDKPEEAFCRLCDVAITSETQAKQHYNGRNHQRRLRGEPPLPKGFFNPITGKWQRQPPVAHPLNATTLGGKTNFHPSPYEHLMDKLTSNLSAGDKLDDSLVSANLNTNFRSVVTEAGAAGPTKISISSSYLRCSSKIFRR
ncbi:zinc finger protein 385D-like isoform X1 [Limulus polyphemus]|uniref:Zinc finger protein 385D-like isoform X1 n=2 Tax=Limulus polyphemus TaxID=6850 RepID=A0ABM1SE77_LIMPO|nr:zinc finger protein 385D-like isoform X1 [Limulus polyphemus]